MAKGAWLLHGATKKVGNIVAYRNPNSNNGDSYAVRERVYEIKNPKTGKQAFQRMRMTPAQNFYRAFRGILNHSWQGVKYGGRSYSKFMQLALADQSIKYPFLLKGDKSFVPGEYPVSYGGLSEISIQPWSAGPSFTTSIMVPGSFSPAGATIATLTAALLSVPNTPFKVGDMITILYAYQTEKGFIPGFVRVKLSNSDATTLASLGLNISVHGDNDVAELNLGFSAFDTCAAAIIHSREPESPSGAWQRSPANMKLSDDFDEIFFSETSYNAAIASYMAKNGNVNSDWYLNGGDGQFSVVPFPDGE